MTAAHCGSCRRQIRWIRTEAGRLMPLDPRPRADGNVILIAATPAGEDLGHVLHKGEDPAAGVPRYMPHWATCPNAAKFRRKNAKTSG